MRRATFAKFDLSNHAVGDGGELGHGNDGACTAAGFTKLRA